MPQLSAEERLLNNIERKVRKGCRSYQLIEDGDRLLVGLSGGKDSLALVELLGRKMRIFAPQFKVIALHVSMRNIGYAADIDYLRHHCEKWNIPFVHHITEFDESSDTRKSPCFLCSWYRRKSMFDIAKEYNCNKIALGHHQDDILQTLLMNMTFQGSFATMPPKLKMSKFDITIVRPLCLVSEEELKLLAINNRYEPQKVLCPHECSSNRPEMKKVLQILESLNPQARHHLWSSMQNIQHEYLP